MKLHEICIWSAGMYLAGCLLLSSGCSSMQHAAQRAASLARGESESESKDPATTNKAGEHPEAAEDEESSQTVALDNRVENALASAAWIATVSKSSGPPPEYRWRHPLLEGLPAEQHLADFHQALESKKPLVAVNARLALARYEHEASPESLSKIVGHRQHPLPVRLAAAELLGKQKTPESAAAVRELIKQSASRELFKSPHYLPDLHAELLYALASDNVAHTDNVAQTETNAEASQKSPLSEEDQAICITGLVSPAPQVRLAAVRAWLTMGQAPLPGELLDRRTDADPRVRGLVMEAIGNWPYEQAREHLTAALNDSDLTVRLAAIHSLGKLSDDESLKTLRRLLNHDAELVRTAVVAALAERRQSDALTEALDDASAHVRLAVARVLADYPHEQRQMLAARLLADSSPPVQQQMAASLANWPIEQAGPLLLTAMGQSGFLVRKAAREELARRWSAAEEFSVDAPAESRAEKLAQLRERWKSEMSAAAAEPSPVAVSLAAATITSTNTTANLLSQVRKGTLVERRRAVDQLAHEASKGPLSDEAAEALGSSILHDTDALLWRSALIAMTGNLSEPATRLAYAALSHPAAEVRRRACEHLRQHPDPRHTEVLLKSLEDADTEVVRAAVQALSASGANADPAPLERLLSASDKTLRIDAAEALIRQGALTGSAALERLTLDSDPAIRQQAAAALGRAGDESALPALMQLLDDQGGVRQAALASLAAIAGQDVARAEQSEPPTNSIEEVRRWRAWYAQRR